MIKRMINDVQYVKVEGKLVWDMIKELKCNYSDRDCVNGDVFIPFYTYLTNHKKYDLKLCQEPMKGLICQFTM
jgi:hypothetical protein